MNHSESCSKQERLGREVNENLSVGWGGRKISGRERESGMMGDGSFDEQLGKGQSPKYGGLLIC